MNVYAIFDEEVRIMSTSDKLERTGKKCLYQGPLFMIWQLRRHIRWLHPWCADEIFRAVTLTKQYDRETRTGEVITYGRSKIKY